MVGTTGHVGAVWPGKRDVVAANLLPHVIRLGAAAGHVTCGAGESAHLPVTTLGSVHFKGLGVAA